MCIFSATLDRKVIEHMCGGETAVRKEARQHGTAGDGKRIPDEGQHKERSTKVLNKWGPL